MSSNTKEAISKKGFSLSLDMWAVIAAFVLALAVRLDILKRIPW